MMISRKKYAILLGMCLGVTAFTGASLSVTKHTDAAVLVHDDSNIAEAIKTVTNTYNILTNLQKQLLIDISNIQKLGAGDWLNILKSQAESETKWKLLQNSRSFGSDGGAARYSQSAFYPYHCYDKHYRQGAGYCCR